MRYDLVLQEFLLVWAENRVEEEAWGKWELSLKIRPDFDLWS